MMNDEIREAIHSAQNATFDDEIELALEKLLDLNNQYPENPHVKTELGILYAKTEQDVKAEQMLASVMTNDPDFERAVSTLGRLYDSLLRTEEAETLYKDYLLRHPDNSYITEDLCRLFESEGRLDESLNLARTHYSNIPNKFDSYNPIRYVLQQVENQLEDDLIEDEFSCKIRIRQVENYLEQLDVFRSILENVDISNQDEIVDLNDDISRVYCELSDLKVQLTQDGCKISSALRKRIENADAFKATYMPE